MKGKVPRRIPRVFPGVGHGKDIGIVEMHPIGIAAVPSFRRRLGADRVTLEPPAHLIMIELFAPKQPRKRLPLNMPGVVRESARSQAVVKFVGFMDSLFEDRIEMLTRESSPLFNVGEA